MSKGKLFRRLVWATALLLPLAVVLGPWFMSSLRGFALNVHERFGVDLLAVMLLFGFGELIFIGSVAMMLQEAGSALSWRAVREFEVKNLRLGSRRMLLWLWVNRASWIVPWLIVIAWSLGKVPWPATAAGLVEVMITLAAGIAVTAGLKLPWWRERNAEAEANGAGYRIRRATMADLHALAAHEAEVWGDEAASEDVLRQRLANSPDGNIIAETIDGRICGYTAYLFLDYEEYERRGTCSWNDLSGHGTACNHDPEGRDLFGINLGCAAWAPKNASTRLMLEVVKAGVQHRVRRGVLGARLPRYHRYAHKMSAHDYAYAERRPGMALDPELRYYYSFGMKPVRLVENYFKDPDSLDWGMIVEMPIPRWMRALGPTLVRVPVNWDFVVERFL